VQWSMWDRIQGVRNDELSTLWRSFIIQALFGFTLNTIPVLVSVLTFGVYVLLGNKLTASEAFTSLSLFTVCLWPLSLTSPQRKQRLSMLWRSLIIQALSALTLQTIPVLVPGLTVGVYGLLGNKPTASEGSISLSLSTVQTFSPSLYVTLFNLPFSTCTMFRGNAIEASQ